MSLTNLDPMTLIAEFAPSPWGRQILKRGSLGCVAGGWQSVGNTQPDQHCALMKTSNTVPPLWGPRTIKCSCRFLFQGILCCCTYLWNPLQPAPPTHTPAWASPISITLLGKPPRVQSGQGGCRAADQAGRPYTVFLWLIIKGRLRWSGGVWGGGD